MTGSDSLVDTKTIANVSPLLMVTGTSVEEHDATKSLVKTAASLKNGSSSSILSEVSTHHLGIQRKVCLRLIAFVANVLVCLALWSAVGQFANLFDHARFDLADELSVRVSGCDVNLVSCDEGSLLNRPQCEPGQGAVQVKWSVYSVRFSIQYRVDQDMALGIVAQNLRDCKTYPGFWCSAFCTVNIFLQPSNARILVKQDTIDQQRIKVTVADVNISSLSVQGANVKTTVRDSLFKSNLRVVSGSGQTVVRNTSAPTSWLSATNGNVVLYHNVVSEGLDIHYRSTSDRSCFVDAVSPRNDSSVLDPNGLWSQCDLSFPNGAFAKALSSRYDSDRSGQVTYSEFKEALGQLSKCCGRKCPFVSTCVQSYLDDYFPLGVTKLSTESFIRMVYHRNDTTIVPGCTRTVLLGNCSTSAGCPKVSLYSNYGKVFVYRHAPSFMGLSSNRTVTSIQNEVVGDVRSGVLLMLKQSADYLRTEIKPRLSSSSEENVADTFTGRLGLASDSLLLMLRVSASPGVPPARFIYTNKPVFFTLEPALLKTISFGLLSPTVVHVDVGFHSKECVNALRNDFDETEKIKRIGLMAAQIFQALSDVRRELLFANLVYVDETHTLENRLLRRFVTDSSTGDLAMVDFVADPFALACFYLSLVIGVLVSAMALFVVRRVGSSLLANRIRQAEIMARLYKLRSNGDFATYGMQLESGVWHGRFFNPFCFPVELCNEILVDSIRKSLVDSLKTFVQTRCRTQREPRRNGSKDKEGFSGKVQPENSVNELGRCGMGDARLANSVQLSDFLRRYERYCIFNNLTFEEDISEVKDKLFQMGVPVRSFMVDRIYGVRWKDEVVEDLVQLTSFNLKSRPLVISKTFDFADFLDLHGEFEALRSRFTSAEASQKVPHELTTEFLRIFCLVTGRRSDYVSYESLQVVYLDSTKKECLGFEEAFKRFCQTVVGTTTGESFQVSTEALKNIGPRRDLQKEEVMRSLRWRVHTARKPVYLDLSWMYLQWVTVSVHMCALLGPPFGCFAIFQVLQDGFARTTASTVNGFPLSNHDLFEILYTAVAEPREYTTLLSWNIATVTGVIAASLMLVLLLSNYCEGYLSSSANNGRRAMFALLLTPYFVFFVAFLACSATWVILLAFLHPEEYLPQGTAVVVFIGSIDWQRKRLQAAALSLRVALEEELHMHIRKKVVTVIRRARAQAGETDVEILFKDKTIESKEIEFDPNDLFVIVDHGSDDLLQRDEFDEIFAWLNLNIGEEKKDQMFVYCDEAGTGTISREEFVKAWSWLEKQIYESVASGVGLSSSKLYVLLAVQALVMLLVFTFLFLATVAFATNGSFQAVVQSFAITFVGFISTQARRKVKGEQILEQGILKKFVSNVV